MPVLNIKILSIHYPERYAVRRLVALAQQELQAEHPGLQVNITEINDPGQICKYAAVIILPTLVINEKVACTGRFPSKEEVAAWLRQAISSG
jgi:hypothetical protein